VIITTRSNMRRFSLCSRVDGVLTATP